MNRTKIIGILVFTIGYVTSVKLGPNSSFGHVSGIFLVFTGLFLMWNGYVADYNYDSSFAIFG
jgi:hypothetical protein